MALIRVIDNNKKVRILLRQYVFFFKIIFVSVCMAFNGSVFCATTYNPDDFGTSKSEPIDSGFFFYGGKYIESPYIVERRGLDVYINDILVRPVPKDELYNYSVDTDPGDPPPGSSPFDPASEGTDRRDRYYPKKWRYLYSHNDYETAKNMIFEVYKNCTELDNVHWAGSDAISVVNKKTGMELKILLSLQNGGKVFNQPTKNDLIERMEKIKKDYERSLQNDTLFFEKEGFSLTLSHSKTLNTIKVLLSDVNDSEKFKILDKNNLINGCQEELPWIVTDFEASSQLQERVDNLEEKNFAKKVAKETSYILNSSAFAPAKDSAPLKAKTQISEEKETTQSPNNVSISIERPGNSPNVISPVNVNIKAISQIENPSHSSKRIIVLSFLSLGAISLMTLYIYRSRHIKSGKEEDL